MNLTSFFFLVLCTRRVQALWGEPWTAFALFMNRNRTPNAYVVVPFRGDVSDLWVRAKKYTADAVKARSREDQPLVVGSNSTPRFGCYSVRNRSGTFSEACRKSCFDQWPVADQSRKRNFRRRPLVCVEDGGKKARTRVGHFQAGCSKRSAAQPRQWVKYTFLLQTPVWEESKSKAGKEKVQELRGISDLMGTGTKPSSRMVDLQWKAKSTRNHGALCGSPQQELCPAKN